MNKGMTLAINGMNAAADHAELVHKDWKEIAFKFLKIYATGNLLFTSEDVRQASAYRVPVPPDSRSWGAVMIRAAKLGIIKKDRVIKYRDKKYHHGYTTLWRSNIYEEQPTLFDYDNHR